MQLYHPREYPQKEIHRIYLVTYIYIINVSQTKFLFTSLAIRKNVSTPRYENKTKDFAIDNFTIDELIYIFQSSKTLISRKIYKINKC